MIFPHKKEPAILLLGDLAVFFTALWGSLYLRYQTIPSSLLFSDHLKPFSFIFAIWILVLYIFDLYARQTLSFKRKLLGLLFRAQLFNSIIAVTFFYFIPYFSIKPKISLFLTLILAFSMLVLWRVYLLKFVYRGKIEEAVILGEGPEYDDLKEEITNNEKYNMRLVDCELKDIIKRKISIIILDLKSAKTEHHQEIFYKLLFEGVVFVDINHLYEQIFDRVPLSLIKESWFLENISGRSKSFYDLAKRGMDIFLALLLGLPALIITPLVALAIKRDDGGPVFFIQERVGRDKKTLNIVKFRSMREGRVTRVGNFLRQSRIDELPQLWNVLRGELSVIGPRPEIPALADIYRGEIAYYDMRHMITPGLSGWAQIYHENHPHHNASVKDTKDKLSYDLYYLKNRSFILDLKIALKTIKTILSRSGA